MNGYTMQMIAHQRLDELARRADGARTTRAMRTRRPRRRLRWSVPVVLHLPAGEAPDVS